MRYRGQHEDLEAVDPFRYAAKGRFTCGSLCLRGASYIRDAGFAHVPYLLSLMLCFPHPYYMPRSPTVLQWAALDSLQHPASPSGLGNIAWVVALGILAPPNNRTRLPDCLLLAEVQAAIYH